MLNVVELNSIVTSVMGCHCALNQYLCVCNLVVRWNFVCSWNMLWIVLLLQFSNMVPDFVITGPQYRARGPAGYLCAGFWNSRWDFRPELVSCPHCVWCRHFASCVVCDLWLCEVILLTAVNLMSKHGFYTDCFWWHLTRKTLHQMFPKILFCGTWPSQG